MTRPRLVFAETLRELAELADSQSLVLSNDARVSSVLRSIAWELEEQEEQEQA